MPRSIIVASLALVSVAVPGLAQEIGGLGLDPSIKDGPHGLARPLQFARTPLQTAQDLQNGMTAGDHQAQDQAMVTRLRGDPGFLSGFSFGTPLAASRQAQAWPYDGGYRYRHSHGRSRGPIIINNDGSLAVTVGNGNVVQQQTAAGGGPIAQQQVATPSIGSRGAGALNVVSGSGNILQRAPRSN